MRSALVNKLYCTDVKREWVSLSTVLPGQERVDNGAPPRMDKTRCQFSGLLPPLHSRSFDTMDQFWGWRPRRQSPSRAEGRTDLCSSTGGRGSGAVNTANVHVPDNRAAEPYSLPFITVPPNSYWSASKSILCQGPGQCVCCGVVVLWCCGVVVLWCGGVVVWWCGGVVVWWCCVPCGVVWCDVL